MISIRPSSLILTSAIFISLISCVVESHQEDAAKRHADEQKRVFGSLTKPYGDGHSSSNLYGGLHHEDRQNEDVVDMKRQDSTGYLQLRDFGADQFPQESYYPEGDDTDDDINAEDLYPEVEADADDNDDEDNDAEDKMVAKRPFGSLTGFRGKRPFGSFTGLTGKRPFGSFTGFKGKRPFGSFTGPRGKRPFGSFTGPRGKRPFGSLTGLRGKRPFGSLTGDKSKRPFGGLTGPRGKRSDELDVDEKRRGPMYGKIGKRFSGPMYGKVGKRPGPMWGQVGKRPFPMYGKVGKRSRS